MEKMGTGYFSLVGLTCSTNYKGSNFGKQIFYNLGEWRRMNVMYECDVMNVSTIKDQNKQKGMASCHQTFRIIFITEL
jgi:hypothetical protein